MTVVIQTDSTYVMYICARMYAEYCACALVCKQNHVRLCMNIIILVSNLCVSGIMRMRTYNEMTLVFKYFTPSSCGGIHCFCPSQFLVLF